MEDLSFTIRPGTVTGFWVRRCRIEHHSTHAASVRSFGERETVKVTIPEVLGEEHGAQPEAVDDCRVRHRAGALAAVHVRLISCR